MLLDALSIHKRLSVTEAAELLGVSAATVRRDFKELARQQLATRTHGGVVATAVAYDLPARYRIAPGDPRERIARAAAELVRPEEVVGFNGGTTTTAIARHLGQRADLRSSGRETITVVTNALNIASELVLRPDIRTVCIGGVALARICTIDQVDGLVTDDVADPDQVRRLRDAGVDVTLV